VNNVGTFISWIESERDRMDCKHKIKGSRIRFVLHLYPALVYQASSIELGFFMKIFPGDEANVWRPTPCRSIDSPDKKNIPPVFSLSKKGIKQHEAWLLRTEHSDSDAPGW
jgi:hypothetical protein